MILNTLFLLQYAFLNGFIIHHFFIKHEESHLLETILSSILLSLSINSLMLYLLIRGIEMPFTKQSVILLSFSLSAILIALGIIWKQVDKRNS